MLEVCQVGSCRRGGESVCVNCWPERCIFTCEFGLDLFWSSSYCLNRVLGRQIKKLTLKTVEGCQSEVLKESHVLLPESEGGYPRVTMKPWHCKGLKAVPLPQERAFREI